MLNKYLYNYYVFAWMMFGFAIHLYDWYDILSNNYFTSFNTMQKLKLVLPTLIITLYIIAFCKHKFLKKNKSV